MEEVVGYVLGLRKVPAARAALRRGGSSVTEHYAYGYLSPWWDDHPSRKDAILAFGSLAAETTGLKQDYKTDFGALVARIVLSGKMKEASAARKITVMQNASLDQMVTIIRSFLLLASAAGYSFDYNDLYWLLALSESKDRAKRIKSRRKVLESYYQHLNRQRSQDGNSKPSEKTEEPSVSSE